MKEAKNTRGLGCFQRTFLKNSNFCNRLLFLLIFVCFSHSILPHNYQKLGLVRPFAQILKEAREIAVGVLHNELAIISSCETGRSKGRRECSQKLSHLGDIFGENVAKDSILCCV